MKTAAAWVLYAAIPAALFVQFAHGNLVWQFILSCAAVLPVAAWMGRSTEHLAHHMGPTSGALFNATFGNFAELIIAILAVRAGLVDVVRASLSGSILGNLLFVAGLAMLMGGIGRQSQKFNQLSSESQAGQMILALSAFLVPALFFRVAAQRHHQELIHSVSIATSVILLVCYGLGLLFSFKTHRDALSVTSTENEGASDGQVWGTRKSLLVLVGASALMAVLAEGLVHAVAAVGRAFGMNEVFMGFIVLAIVGNAAEHSTAVVLAMRNQMDTALNIAMQSSVQIALLVTPLLIFLSYPLGHPLDLLFTPLEILALSLGVMVFAYLVMNGETNWFEGVQLLAVYAIIAVALYFLPSAPAEAVAAPRH